MFLFDRQMVSRERNKESRFRNHEENKRTKKARSRIVKFQKFTNFETLEGDRIRSTLFGSRVKEWAFRFLVCKSVVYLYRLPFAVLL